MHMKKILIVDDEEDILEFVGYNLRKAGYTVITATDGAAGFEMAKERLPDLVLLDVMMPNLDGMEVCEKLRALPEFKETIIAFLTSRSEDYFQLAGFESGADDYIHKPIKPKLLVAKVNSLLKRSASQVEETIEDFGCVKVDRNKRIVISGDTNIELPKKEYDLLLLLLSNVGKVFSREAIYDSVWGNDTFVGDRTIDVHIRKLREKLGDNCIKTLKGVGYKYNELCLS
ncbi:MAG: response regulator transcription factor [Flavobacteriales bacterium]|nr:response regulator transcription factor [Flavobacteriales bacterium]